MKEKRRPDADRQPSTAATSGLLELGEPSGEPPRRKVAAPDGGGDKIAEVVPAVNTPPLPLSTNAPTLVVALGHVEGLDQRFVHRPGDRVLLLRPGEGGRHGPRRRARTRCPRSCAVRQDRLVGFERGAAGRDGARQSRRCGRRPSRRRSGRGRPARVRSHCRHPRAPRRRDPLSPGTRRRA